MEPKWISLITISSIFIFILLISIVDSTDVLAIDVNNDIDLNTTWSKGGNPWNIRDDIVVRNGAILTIDPGVQVRFRGTFSILCEGDGRILANGIADDMIIITSSSPSIYNYSSISTGIDGLFKHCSFSYGDVCIRADNDANIHDCIIFNAPKGIEIVGDHVAVTRCNITNCEYGIFAIDCSEAIIDDSTVSFCSKGFNLIGSTEDTIVFNCIAQNCDIRGVEIDTTGLNNSVSNTRFYSNRMAILVWRSEGVALGHLVLEECYDGIGIFDPIGLGTHPIRIENVLISGGHRGLRLSGAKWTFTTNSTFREIDIGVSEWHDSGPGIRLWRNNFLWNTEQVEVETTIINWSYNGTGNFWSDYDGKDLNEDGIGDLAYNVSMSNFDRFPLIRPVDFEHPIAVASEDIYVRQHEWFELNAADSSDDTWITNWTWILNISGENHIVFGEVVTYSIDTVGVYQAILIVTDAVGKTARDGVLISISDGEPPEYISFEVPEFVHTGEHLQIACHVIDNVGVAIVSIDLYLGGGPPQRYDLEHVSGMAWGLSVEVSLDLKEDIYFILTARDADGNLNSTDYFTVDVLDGMPPTLIPLPPKMVTTGDNAFLNCTISDNWEVRNASVEYWFPDGTRSIQNISNIEDVWSVCINIPSNATSPLMARFTGMDQSGNLGRSPIFDVSVLDDDSPEIIVYSTSPTIDNVHKGDHLLFSVIITDNIDVKQASVEMKYYATEWESHQLDRKDGEFLTSISIPTGQGNRLWFRFNASDASGNVLLTDALEVFLLSVNPIITTEPPTEIIENEEYTITFDAMDSDNEMSELRWELDTNATWLTFDPDSVTLHGTPIVSDIGVYFVNISVEDGDGGSDFLHYLVKVHDFNFPPSVEIISPPDSAKVGSSILISGRATDDDDTILWVRIRIDDGEWNKANGTQVWKYTLSTKNLDRGVHTITALTYDGVSESEVTKVSFIIPEDKEDGNPIGLWVTIAAIVVAIVVLAFYLRPSKEEL
jgi:hypothetical protein